MTTIILNHGKRHVMQTVDIVEALSLIKWLLGVVAFLLSGIGLIGGYFVGKIHNTIIKDHDLLTEIHTEHKSNHPKKVMIG